MMMFSNPGIPPTRQDRPEPPTAPVSLPVFDLSQIAPQDPSDTLHTPHVGGNREKYPLFATQSPLGLAMSTHSPPHLTPNIQIPPQTTREAYDSRNVPQMGGNIQNGRSGVVPDPEMALTPTRPTSPPRHARRLYHSIPLPEFDDEEPPFWPQPTPNTPSSPLWSPTPTMWSWLPPPPTGRSWYPSTGDDDESPNSPLQTSALGLCPESVRLHPIVRRALFDPFFTSKHLDADPSVARRLWDSAADFGVRQLSIWFLGCGALIDVEPSVRSGGIVRVGDVLRALRTAPENRDEDGAQAGVFFKGVY